jgi:hypothetical protein
MNMPILHGYGFGSNIVADCNVAYPAYPFAATDNGDMLDVELQSLSKQNSDLIVCNFEVVSL